MMSCGAQGLLRSCYKASARIHHPARRTFVHGMATSKEYPLGKNSKLVIQKGDLTEWSGDAVVNAANEIMLGGGGVDGAIHRAAGPELLSACRAVPQKAGKARCPTGQARITPGFKLPAKWVIHTVGPVYSDENKSKPLLASAYRSSLDLANEHKLSTIAFPALSCGVYGYPLNLAARTSLEVCRDRVGNLNEIHFVLFSNESLQAYEAAADELFS